MARNLSGLTQSYFAVISDAKNFRIQKNFRTDFRVKYFKSLKENFIQRRRRLNAGSCTSHGVIASLVRIQNRSLEYRPSRYGSLFVGWYLKVRVRAGWVRICSIFISVQKMMYIGQREDARKSKVIAPHELLGQACQAAMGQTCSEQQSWYFQFGAKLQKKEGSGKKLILELHEKCPKFISKDNGRNDLIGWF